MRPKKTPVDQPSDELLKKLGGRKKNALDDIPRCLSEGCNRSRHSRGLCSTCYAAAHKLIKTGDITWAKLVSLNLALPSDYASRRRYGSSPFVNALRASLIDSQPGKKTRPTTRKKAAST